MLESYFVRPHTVDRIRASWLGPAIEQYVTWLVTRGEAARNLGHRVPVLMQFGTFASATGATRYEQIRDRRLERGRFPQPSRFDGAIPFRRPFRGPTRGAVLGEILTKAPTALIRLNPDLPPELEQIVNKLLEKDRSLRCQSACDARIDLERLRRSLAALVPGRAAQASMVVLPFENLSSDSEQEYFCDGMTDEIISALRTSRRSTTAC